MTNGTFEKRMAPTIYETLAERIINVGLEFELKDF